MVAVDHWPPDVVELGRTCDGIQPPVVDNQPVGRLESLMIRPESEITELNHASAAMPRREFAEIPYPVEVAMRVTSHEQTRRVAGWLGYLEDRHGEMVARHVLRSVPSFDSTAKR
jgi:hypothetical protein